MAILIDTNRTHMAVEQITKENTSIDAELSFVTTAVAKLSQNWVGEASNKCNGAYKHIESSYRTDRHNVLQNFGSFLHNQVTGEYENIEAKIAGAADAFK